MKSKYTAAEFRQMRASLFLTGIGLGLVIGLVIGVCIGKWAENVRLTSW